MLVFGFFAVIAIVFAFPLRPSQYGRALAGDSGDALLNLWILHWSGHHMFSGWSELWNTSSFWPEHNTLAYSESMLPVRAGSPDPRAWCSDPMSFAFNALYVAAWTASGWVTYLFARRLRREAVRAPTRRPRVHHCDSAARDYGISSSRWVSSSLSCCSCCSASSKHQRLYTRRVVRFRDWPARALDELLRVDDIRRTRSARPRARRMDLEQRATDAILTDSASLPWSGR